MTTMDFLTINNRIVADDFDDEMVLIDVQKGLYFSMRGSAKEVWKAFKEPQSQAALLAAFADQYSAEQVDEIKLAIDKMAEHELLVSSAPPKKDAAAVYALSGVPFVAPSVDVFTDMAELIAIDPVHEVDEAAGWPVRPASFPAQA
jgi:hypothetical protein